MATIVLIEKDLDTEISELEAQRIQLEPFVFQQEKCSPEVKIKFHRVLDSLRAIRQYKALYEKKAPFEQIKHLKFKSPNKYIEECRKLVKDIKGVTFDKEKGMFRVRVIRSKQKIDLGYYDTPSEAVDSLKVYFD